MSAWVRVLEDAIEIGATAVTGRALPSGGVEVDGTPVRALTLEDRADLLGLALQASEDPAQRLAELVGIAATGADRRQSAAVEAVALELAGAGLDGPLARTALLVGRALGAAAGALHATHADLLADSLAGSLAHAPEDTGWTTLRFGAEPEPAAGVEATRDLLARRLLARADAPLEPELARALLTVDALGDLSRTQAATAAVIDRAAARDGGRRPWYADALAMASVVDAAAVARTLAAAGEAPGHREGSPRVSAADAGPATGTGRPAAVMSPVVGTQGTQSGAGESGDAVTGALAEAQAGADARAGLVRAHPGRAAPGTSGAGGRAPSPRAAAQPHPAGRWAPRAYRARMTMPLAARPAPDLMAAWWPTGSGVGPVAGPGATAATGRTAAPTAAGAAGMDLDAAAHALHRAADLRGAP